MFQAMNGLDPRTGKRAVPDEDSVGGLYGWAKKKAKQGWDKLEDATDRDPNNLQGQVVDASKEGLEWGRQGREGYGSLGREADAERDYLRKVARGEESVSKMQLAQALQRNQAMQQSMAAAARPGNAAMAARNAAANAGRQGAALAGQQAIAGIQERQQAQMSLQDAILKQRQQDLAAAQGGYGLGIGGLSSAYGAAMGTPTAFERGVGLIGAGIQGYASLKQAGRKQ